MSQHFVDSGYFHCSCAFLISKMAASKEFLWTDDEIELLLRCAIQYKAKCEYEGLSWEGTRSKYEKIKEIIMESYPNSVSGDQNLESFPRIGKTEIITKERVSAKLKKIRKDYKKAVDCGRKSGGGRVVFTFYDLCESLWGGSPAVESMDGGIEPEENPVQPESELEMSAETSTPTSPEDVGKEEEIPSSDTSTEQRRVKISEMLKNRKDKKMNHKLTPEAQYLNCAKEDLNLKRKLIDRLDKEDFKERMAQVNKTIETIGESIKQSMGLLAELMRPTAGNLRNQTQPFMQYSSYPYGEMGAYTPGTDGQYRFPCPQTSSVSRSQINDSDREFLGL